MEFAAMKRRDLLKLCQQHGLATRGSKADLAASLAGALSVAAAATTENVVEVVVGKGCLKRLGGSASSGTSGAAKKVRFALDEKLEERARRRSSQVILQPVITKKRGRRKAKKALHAAAMSERGRRRKCDDVGGDSADEDISGEAGADAPETCSRMKTLCLHARHGVGSWNNPARAEEKWEVVVGAAIHRKQKQKTQENAEIVAANAQVGISRRITRRSSPSVAAVLLSPDVEKREGRKTGDGKDEVVAEGQAAEVQYLTTAASQVIVESRTSRKGGDCIPSVQKPSKVVVSCHATRSSSVAAIVMLPSVIGNKRRQTRGRPKAREALPDTALNRRGSRRKHVVGSDAVDHGSFGEVGTDAPVTQSGTKAMNLCAESGVESRNDLAGAEEQVEVIGVPTYMKQKIQDNVEDIAANAQAGVCHRSTGKSSSPSTDVLLSSVVEKKMEVGDGMDKLGVKALAEVKVLATAALPIISESISKRKGEDCIPADLKPAKVEVYGRTIRSHSVAAPQLLPTVIGNKARKPEDVHPNGEICTYLEVPQNDAPVTRLSRNKIVQSNNSVVEETHVAKKLETKSKPSRTATRRRPLLLASSVLEKEKVVAPYKLPQHTKSRRYHPQADELFSNADSETNKLSRAQIEAKDLKITQPSTCHTSKTSLEDVVLMAEKESGFTKRSTSSNKDKEARNGGGISLAGDDGKNTSSGKTELGVLDDRTIDMHESVSGEEFQNTKGGDEGNQPAVRGPVRRSTRKCVVAGLRQISL